MLEHALRVFVVRGFIRPDPLAFPVAGIEEPHGPARGIAPRRSLSVLAPHLHAPEDLLAGRQRLAGVDNLRGFAGVHFAGIPNVSFSSQQSRLARCRFDPVCGLSQSSRARLHREHQPAQARFPFVDAGRIHAVLAAECGRVNRRSLREGETGCQRRNQNEKQQQVFHMAKRNSKRRVTSLRSRILRRGAALLEFVFAGIHPLLLAAR
jgi:hypothetical protein